MKYTQLGQTDVQISKICLGTMTFGQQNSREEAWKQIDMAKGRGVNFMDTAEMYPVPANAATQGSTEQFIGDYFAKNKKRNEWIIATKVTGPGKHVSHIAGHLGFSKERMRDAIQKSLKRLHTDHIDLYQLHWPERPTNCFGRLGYPVENAGEWIDNFEEVIHTLWQFREEGLIRAWGLSNETPWGLMRALKVSESYDNFFPATIQNPYNLLNRTFEVGLSEMAMREGVGLLAYSPLAFGLLTGKYHDQSASSESRLNQFPQMARYSSDVSFEVASQYINLAKEYHLSPAQMGIAYILKRPFLYSVIAGATSLKQLSENIDSANMELPDELLRKIEDIHKSHSNPAP